MKRRRADARVQLPRHAPRAAICRVDAAKLHRPPVREVHLHAEYTPIQS